MPKVKNNLKSASVSLDWLFVACCVVCISAHAKVRPMREDRVSYGAAQVPRQGFARVCVFVCLCVHVHVCVCV